MKCKNCKAEVDQNYCANCGHPIVLRRIDGKYIVNEVWSVLNFQNGILYTIRGLAIKPGACVKDFLVGNRNRLVKPILFLILSSFIYTVLNNLVHFEGNYIDYSDQEITTRTYIFQWIQGNYGYANIIMAVFIALWLKLFFRKYQYNIFEIVILLCFIMGMGMLIYSIFGTIQAITNLESMQAGVILGFLYTTFAIGQFFDKRRVMSYLKALFAYLLGMISFTILALLIGTLIDLVIKP